VFDFFDHLCVAAESRVSTSHAARSSRDSPKLLFVLCVVCVCVRIFDDFRVMMMMMVMMRRVLDF